MKTISEFINLCTEASGITFVVFDLNEGKEIHRTNDSDELLCSEYSEDEIESFDVYADKGTVTICFNVIRSEEEE